MNIRNFAPSDTQPRRTLSHIAARAVSGLVLLALASVFSCGTAQAQSTVTNTVVLDVTAYIDGRDLLMIQGNTLQWHHLDYAAVGRFGGGNEPTTISSTLNGVTQMDSIGWTPTWPQSPPDEIRSEAYSSVFTGLTPSLPAAADNITLTPIESRDSTSIFQLPSASNNYTLIIDFNDDSPFGPAWYESQITYTTTSPVPETSSFVSLGLLFCLGGGAVARRKQKTKQ